MLSLFNPWLEATFQADAWLVSHGPPALWRERQNQRLHQLLLGIARRSPAWRARLGPAAGSSDDARALLARLPVTHKHELMAHWPDWLTDATLDVGALRAFAADPARRGEAFDGRCMVWQSSGSSGEPALFVHDERSMAVTDALEAVRGPLTRPGRYGMPPMARPGARLAYVGATEGPFAGIVALQRLRALNPWLATASRAFDFLQPLPALLAQLDEWQPQVLSSYPSMAWVLAQAQRAGRLAIAPEVVWTGGETLTPGQRSAISEAFHGAPVHDSYGASECLTIAHACALGHLHLNADWVLLEAVDEAVRPVPDGEPGHTTLLTWLANETQPIVRYDLGDRVRFVTEPCDCGSALPVIEVRGRCSEVITLADRRGHSVSLCPLALATVLEEQGGLFDFELRPLGCRGLTLSAWGVDAAVAHRAASALHAWLTTQGLPAIRVSTRHRFEHGPRGGTGKLQRLPCGPQRFASEQQA
jgi:phenylacetate-CoA ligase